MKRLKHSMNALKKNEIRLALNLCSTDIAVKTHRRFGCLCYIGSFYSTKNSKIYSGKNKKLFNRKQVQKYLNRLEVAFSLQASVRFKRLAYFYFQFPDNGRRDLLNIAQGIADVMVKTGFLKDDSWQHFVPIFEWCCVDAYPFFIVSPKPIDIFEAQQFIDNQIETYLHRLKR